MAVTNGDNAMAVTEMPLSNYQRQKKWRDKNRAIYNLRRRNARKLAGSQPDELGRSGVAQERLTTKPAHLSIDQLRQLLTNPAPVEPIRPLIFKDDHGMIITEHQWETLQKLKAKALNGGYVLDDYTQ